MFTLAIALISRIFSNPIANACQKKLGETSSSLSVNFYTSLIMSLGCIFPALKIDWLMYSAEFWWYVILAGLFCSLGTICLIKALKFGELSILGPLNSYKSVIGLISAFLLLGELPSGLAICGMGLIILGSFYLITPQKSAQIGRAFWLAVMLRFTALVFTGCEASILKKIIMMSSPLTSFVLWCFSGLILGAFFIVVLGRKFEQIKRTDVSKYILAAICLSVMQFSTNIVFSKMEVGAALALFQLSAIVNLVLGYKIFREGGMLRKAIGTIIMIFGSVVILFN